ncbi:hypothetical protein L596_023168 [Steinernema carpocapsae]|uniref:Uncharacterized protein n=1 Tax=Steinernema carpocapsae TaxID=34508 RepID=A0A4U5MCU6_STECR|nr:hypothetical protein L596_023168 [Steinernema carpocapsae]
MCSLRHTLAALIIVAIIGFIIYVRADMDSRTHDAVIKSFTLLILVIVTIVAVLLITLYPCKEEPEENVWDDSGSCEQI